MMDRFLILDGFHTLRDGHMTLAAYEFPQPQVRSSTVTVPGLSGAVDLSFDAAGEPDFDRRIMRATLECSYGDLQWREELFTSLCNRFNGRICKIVPPGITGKYAVGTVQLTVDYSNLAHGCVLLEAECDPFVYETEPQWLSVPLLHASDNLCTTENTTVVDNNGTSAHFSLLRSWPLFTVAGSPYTGANLRVALAADTSYFVSARILDEPGAFDISLTSDGPAVTGPIVTTDSTGLIFIRLRTLTDAGVGCSLRSIFICPAASVAVAHNGRQRVYPVISLPCDAHISIGNVCELYVAFCGQRDIMRLPCGDTPVAAFADNGATGEVTLTWTRGWL